MKEVERIFSNVLMIESEPGDMTRYSYFVYKDGPDEFHFMPKDSTFRFPQRLNYFEVIDVEDETIVGVRDEQIIKLATRENCNPHTIKECIRTIIEYHERRL